MGESGSGKTSLAKCIVGLIDPTEGTIEFEHMDVTKGRARGREARRRLQMVFQNPDNALNPSHTVRLDPAPLAAAARRRAGASGSRTPSWRR